MPFAIETGSRISRKRKLHEELFCTHSFEEKRFKRGKVFHWLTKSSELVLAREKTMENLAQSSSMPGAKKSSATRERSKRSPAKKKTRSKRWSAKVMEQSDALDLESEIFKSKEPRQIALSLKRSAKASKRRKGTPYQSAMSMLNFYINRAGKNLPKNQRHVLERAKDELREVFGRNKPAD